MSKEKIIKLTLKRSVKLDTGWKQPGDVCEVEPVEATRLIRLGAAVSFEKETDAKEQATQDTIDLISAIEGVSDKTAANLIDAGFDTVQKVSEAEPDDLMAVNGIGEKSVEKIQDAAESMLAE